MVSQGIYTLANDVVFDQMVALLNSIEVNVSHSLPICIIPYDDRLEKVKRELKQRPNVSLFDNSASLQRWDQFAHQVWNAHPRSRESNLSRPKWYKGNLHRKFLAFDGEFDEFVFYEADNLAMKPIDDVFAKLQDYDFVFDDWEHRKPDHSAALNLNLMEKTGLFSGDEIRPKLHDASFFGSKKGLFSPSELAELQTKLIDKGEVDWINGIGWWDDVFLFNYLTFRCNRPLYNFTQSEDSRDKTGNCADSNPFVEIDNVLYNEEGLKPIHRIHYMNYPSIDFTRLCQGEEVNIRYQEIFLTYRFLKNPEAKPTQLVSPSALTKLGRKFQTYTGKVKKVFS